MMTLDKVCVSYDNKPVLRDFTLSLPDKGCYALTGASGSGKTTLLRVMAGLKKPDSGSVTTSGRITLLFQEDRLLPWLTALENVCLPLERAQTDSAASMLCALGLADAIHQYPPQLSGGMQRRVALARALMRGGDILLLDEPFKGLDADVKAIAAKLCLQTSPLVVIATHDEAEISLMNAARVPVSRL